MFGLLGDFIQSFVFGRHVGYMVCLVEVVTHLITCAEEWLKPHIRECVDPKPVPL